MGASRSTALAAGTSTTLGGGSSARPGAMPATRLRIAPMTIQGTVAARPPVVSALAIILAIFAGIAAGLLGGSVPHKVAAVRALGYSDDISAGILGGNFARLMGIAEGEQRASALRLHHPPVEPQHQGQEREAQVVVGAARREVDDADVGLLRIGILQPVREPVGHRVIPGGAVRVVIRGERSRVDACLGGRASARRTFRNSTSTRRC